MLTADEARRIAAEPCEFGTATLRAALDCLYRDGRALADSGARLLLLRELDVRERRVPGQAR